MGVTIFKGRKRDKLLFVWGLDLTQANAIPLYFTKSDQSCKNNFGIPQSSDESDRMWRIIKEIVGNASMLQNINAKNNAPPFSLPALFSLLDKIKASKKSVWNILPIDKVSTFNQQNFLNLNTVSPICERFSKCVVCDTY